MVNRVSLKDVPAKWRAREEFNANGTLYGTRHVGMASGSSRLSGSDLDEWRDNYWRTDRKGIAYVVVSYSTPIAWVRRDGTEYKVVQRFSVTTSRHQSRLY